ncbi:MAG: hypothetical protein K0S70_365 [Microbacterium sp.]|jgi:hypothetical protein|nr:hypothetical protein [Microbacterium sp.]
MTVTARRLLEPALIVALTVVGSFVTWFRVPADHRDRVWAEDANIFLEEALVRGPWSVLFEGYAGYQHFVPRVVMAGVLPVLDLAHYPVVIFAICSVLTGLTAAGVFWLSRDLVPSVTARVALAAITFLIPLATQETIGNLADLHSYAMWLAPWLLLYRPRSWWTSAGWALVTFAVVMTEIQAVFFVFLLFFRLRPRDRHVWPVAAAFLVASVVQVITAATGGRDTSNGPLSIPSTVAGWIINAVMPLVSADPETIVAWVTTSGLLVGIAILVPIAAAGVYVLIRGNTDQRVLAIALALGSAAVYTGSAWANSGPWFAYAEAGFGDMTGLAVNIRYGVASGMMLAALIPLALSVFVSRSRGGVVVGSLGVVLNAGLVAVLAIGMTTAVSSRGWVDRWEPAVNDAVEACLATPGLDEATLPVAPDRSVDVSCDDLVSRRG